MTTVEEQWSEEFGEPVEIREVAGWNEFDVYLSSEFMVTTVSIAAAEDWLARYLMVKDEVA